MNEMRKLMEVSASLFDSRVESDVARVISENVSDKARSIIDNWISKHGNRGAAEKLVDLMLDSMVGLSSSDLSDSVIFANGLDEIEDLLADGDYKLAISASKEIAKEMMDDEGFDGMFGV